MAALPGPDTVTVTLPDGRQVRAELGPLELTVARDQDDPNVVRYTASRSCAIVTREDAAPLMGPDQ